MLGTNAEDGAICGFDLRDLLVLAAVVLCVSNVLLVSALAATGTLRTAQQGDIETTQSTTIESRTVELPAGQQFIIESPTDADVFYNIVVLVQNGGPLYTDVGQDPFVQLIFNYFPVVYFLFPPLVSVGYVPFKFVWLLLAVIATVGGTALLLRAETHHHSVPLSNRTLWALSLASIGFQPMVANFKVGQTTPIIYFFVGLFWYLFRHGRLWASGGALAGAVLFKPYFGAPLVVAARYNRWRAVSGFVATYALVNALSVLSWGLDTTLEYYQKLLHFLLKEGQPAAYDSFSAWSASHLRIFYWLGSYASPVRLLILVPAVAVVARSTLGYDEDPTSVFSLALVAIIAGLETTTAIDLGVLLAAIVVLGFRFYTVRDTSWPLVALVLAFSGLQSHGYIMELLVGWGSQNIVIIGSNESLVLTFLPVLQPGTYSIFLLYGLGLHLSTFLEVGQWLSKSPR